MGEWNKAVIRQDDFQVLSANAESYAFIGDRFYHSFDHLVAPEDLPVFSAEVARCAAEYFPVRLLDAQGEAHLYMAQAQPSANPQAAVVTFVAAGQLMGMLEHQERLLEMKNHILSIYGDEFFEYNARTDRFHIYRLDKFEQTIAEVSLQDFFDHLAENVKEKDRPALAQFCADLRNRKTTLYLQAGGNLMDQREAALTLIKGLSLYEQGEYTGAAGVIHFGARRAVRAGMTSERDPLTGLLSKAEITAAAINMIDDRKLADTNIIILDVDYFKTVNDTFGHMAGDNVLKRIASILVDEVAGNGLVGRIGGDEFMIVYFHVANMENNRELLRSVKNRVAAIYPAGGRDTPAVSLSIGCAAFPKDADCYEDLFRLADYAMYRAKHNGRNRYVIFDREKHGTLTEVLTSTMTPRRLNDRGDMSVGDLMCAIMSQVFRGEGAPIDQLLENAAVDLELQRMILYAGHPWQVVCMAGSRRPDPKTMRETIGYLDDPGLWDLYDEHGVMVLDDVERIGAKGLPCYEQMRTQGILSCIHLRGRDADGKPFLLSLESVSSRVTWNPEWVRYYALFQQVLERYHLL